jgi:LysR family hydrogen peroxide-inducible transcriptional activator
MQLLIQENFTHKLAEMLKQGEVDVIIIALPFAEPGVATRAVYDEPFLVAVPRGHAWEKKKSVSADELTKESLLLLGEGHCFRDQVLEFCHAAAHAPQRSGLSRALEGGSLETIRQMVASGVGVTVLPSTSVAAGGGANDLIRIRPFARPVPDRRVALAWRKSFPRPQAIEALRQAILACDLPQVTKLPSALTSG